MRPVIAALVLALVAAVAAAPPLAAEGPVSASILDIDDSDFPIVRVTLSITDGTGRTLTGLATTNFTAEESEARAAVSRIEVTRNEQIGVGVVLAIDTSASMRGTAITQAKEAAGAFVRSLAPADQAAVVSFANQATVLAGLTADRTASLGAIGRIEAIGDTALYDGVMVAVQTGQEATLPGRAIVFLSDGREFGGRSRATREQALLTAAAARIPIYVIGLGPDIDREFLLDLARLTGGALLDAPSPAAVPALYEQLSQLLRSQYVLTLRSEARPDLEDRSVRVTVSTPAGSAQVGSNYRTRRTITAAAPAPVVEVPPPAPPDGGSSQAPVLIGLALAGIIVAGGAGRYAYRWSRERRLATDLAGLSERASGFAVAPPAVTMQAAAPLALVVHGPGSSERFVMSEEPLTIGSAAGCQIKLGEDGRVSSEHARVWWSAGKVMFHQLASGQPSLVKGNPVTWVSLKAGDEVTIGPYHLKVEPA